MFAISPLALLAALGFVTVALKLATAIDWALDAWRRARASCPKGSK